MCRWKPPRDKWEKMSQHLVYCIFHLLWLYLCLWCKISGRFPNHSFSKGPNIKYKDNKTFWSKWGTLWNNVIHIHGNLPWYFAFCNNWVVTDLFDLIDLKKLLKLLPLEDIVDLLDLMDELWTSFDKQLMNRARMYLQPQYGNGVFGNVYFSAGQH